MVWSQDLTGILGSRTDNHRHGFCGCAERSRRSWQIDQKRRLFSFSPIPHGWRPSVEPASARRRCAAIRPCAAESVRLRWVATSHHLPATSRCIRAPTLRPDPGTTPAATARQPSFPLIAARHGVANRILRTVSAIRESSGDPFTSLLRSTVRSRGMPWEKGCPTIRIFRRHTVPAPSRCSRSPWVWAAGGTVLMPQINRANGIGQPCRRIALIHERERYVQAHHLDPRGR